MLEVSTIAHIRGAKKTSLSGGISLRDTELVDILYSLNQEPHCKGTATLYKYGGLNSQP